MRKFIFLILTLAIPVSIFLFLKFFGSNTFEVPVLFEDGIPGCQASIKSYSIPEFDYIGETEKTLSSRELQGFLVFGVLNGRDVEKNKEKLVELVRVQDAFYEVGAPKFVLFVNGELENMSRLIELSTEMGLEQETRNIAYMAGDQLNDFLQCGIALIDDKSMGFDNLVLVDSERKIRGIYQITEIEQTDQLILELKILKQKS